MNYCLAMYEPEATPPATHTCKLMDGHPGPHICPRCDSSWEQPGGLVTKLPPILPHEAFRDAP